MNHNILIYRGVEFTQPIKQEQVRKLVNKEHLDLVAKVQGGEDGYTAALDDHYKREEFLLTLTEKNQNLFRNFHGIEILNFGKPASQDESKTIKNSPMEILKLLWGIFILSLILGGIVFIIYGYFANKDERAAAKEIRHERREQTVAAMNAVTSALKDGSSAKFQNELYNCGYVDSKNGFGAYTGYKRYVVVGGQVFLENNNVSDDQLNLAWINLCKK